MMGLGKRGVDIEVEEIASHYMEICKWEAFRNCFSMTHCTENQPVLEVGIIRIIND